LRKQAIYLFARERERDCDGVTVVLRSGKSKHKQDGGKKENKSEHKIIRFVAFFISWKDTF